MSFIQIGDTSDVLDSIVDPVQFSSIAIHVEDIIFIALENTLEGGWALKVYMRGRNEPIKMNGEKSDLIKVYNYLISNVGEIMLFTDISSIFEYTA